MIRVLIAGIGNVFLGDDGFGVEVVRRLAETPLPAGVELADVGIRGLHLAYQLAEGYDLFVAVDTVSRGGAPGTLYVVEPQLADEPGRADAHSIDLQSVFAMVRALDGKLGRVLVVGCEPESLEERIGLSPIVEAAIAPTVQRIRHIAEGAETHATQAQ
jgi:hydrogenase maturation protease